MVGRPENPERRRRAEKLLVPWSIGPDARIRLVALGWAGAGASVFHEWADVLAPEINLYAVRLPGRESRFAEGAAPDVQVMAAEIADAIGGGSPVALLGLCTGAIVMFETARVLEATGRAVAAFCVVSQPAPAESSFADAARLAQRPIREVLERLGHTDAAILSNPDLLALVEPAVKGDLRAIGRYSFDARPPLQAPVHAFYGHDDRTVAPEQLAMWRDTTTGSFVMIELRGDHLFTGDARRSLAAAVSCVIADAAGVATPPAPDGST